MFFLCHLDAFIKPSYVCACRLGFILLCRSFLAWKNWDFHNPLCSSSVTQLYNCVICFTSLSVFSSFMIYHFLISSLVWKQTFSFLCSCYSEWRVMNTERDKSGQEKTSPKCLDSSFTKAAFTRNIWVDVMREKNRTCRDKWTHFLRQFWWIQMFSVTYK